MKTIAHISDLHFGAEDPALVEALLADLEAARPAVLAVSGDLTQRARTREFEAARQFLERARVPRVVVPGNHDIPLFNPFARFFKPLGKFREQIDANEYPIYSDDELAIVGINTAHPAALAGGRISRGQADEVSRRLDGLGRNRFRVVVTHHPFMPRPGDRTPELIAPDKQALALLKTCGADLLLAGHLHLSYSGDVRSHFSVVSRSILVAQAGTAISRRTRGEPNAYNLITIDGPSVEIVPRTWGGGAFRDAARMRYQREGGEWRQAGTAERGSRG